MREFVLNNKSKIVQAALLLVVFFFVVTFINGRSLYKERVKMMEQEHQLSGSKA